MYVKIYEQIFDSSLADDWELRTMFIDMLILADRDGVVDRTYEAIAARTRRPIEQVRALIRELTQPEPASRSFKATGARLVLLDPGQRLWGWRIPQYAHYRNLTSDEDRCNYYRGRRSRLRFVYYARHEDRVKIALSGNPWARIAKLKGRYPGVELVAREEGDDTKLSQRQKEFSDETLADNWFSVSKKLEKHINVLATTDLKFAKGSQRNNNSAKDLTKGSERVAKGSQVVAKGSQGSQNTNGNFIGGVATGVARGSQVVAKGSQKGGYSEAEAEACTEVPSAVSLKGRPPTADPNLFVTDYSEAKRLICEKILNGKDPNRLWSPDADHRLLKHLPMPRQEIDRVAWWRRLPNDGSPELEARKPITETGLMNYWGDEVTRANAYWWKLNGWREKKKAAG